MCARVATELGVSGSVLRAVNVCQCTWEPTEETATCGGIVGVVTRSTVVADVVVVRE